MKQWIKAANKIQPSRHPTLHKKFSAHLGHFKAELFCYFSSKRNSRESPRHWTSGGLMVLLPAKVCQCSYSVTEGSSEAKELGSGDIARARLVLAYRFAWKKTCLLSLRKKSSRHTPWFVWKDIFEEDNIQSNTFSLCWLATALCGNMTCILNQ